VTSNSEDIDWGGGFRRAVSKLEIEKKEQDFKFSNFILFHSINKSESGLSVKSD